MADLVAESIRVRGTVQGVGLRPTVWRLARETGVAGSVLNDAEGVLITAVATPTQIDALVQRLAAEPPPLAQIDSIERRPQALPSPLPEEFVIDASRQGSAHTAVAADAATCAACVAEIFDPFARRFRYPLGSCTHCGPRLSFTLDVPYDRPATTMAGYPLCPACQAEYHDPADRRFHAQAIACHVCGPKVRLQRFDGRVFSLDSFTFLDDCDAAGSLLARGEIVAIKGLGGYQLACDATQADAVGRLRALKRREAKPFALMAANVDAVRVYCRVDEAEAALLASPAAPIVLLDRVPGAKPAIADEVAPGLRSLGFMLPSTGLHHLVLRRMKRPIVLTSGNLSDEPQAITLAELKARFAVGIGYALDHDRPIARRVDDSVQRITDGAPRVQRRARGLAPQPLVLPPGLAAAPPVLAYGGELKNTVCLLRDGQAVLGAHVGDLADAATQADWRRQLADLQRFFAFEPTLHAIDAHPDYHSSQHARTVCDNPVEVLHHHAHIAACLADNGWPLDAGPVVGVALDGLGMGEHGELWGGEFAIADYNRFDRRGTFKPVALLGGEAAMHEPWRNTYAHLMAEMKWPSFSMNYGELQLHHFLKAQPRAVFDVMLSKGLNSALASSAGRLFDAAAAAMGICRDRAAYEGQGAVEMEALVDAEVLQFEDEELGYPFAIPRLPAQVNAQRLPYIEPLAMWSALLGDLVLKTPVPTMAARFHKGLAAVVCKMVDKVAAAHDVNQPLKTVALSGGVFQNRVLLERISARLRDAGYTVLAHRQVPCNDGGLALGQAVVAAARAIKSRTESQPCA